MKVRALVLGVFGLNTDGSAIAAADYDDVISLPFDAWANKSNREIYEAALKAWRCSPEILGWDIDSSGVCPDDLVADALFNCAYVGFRSTGHALAGVNAQSVPADAYLHIGLSVTTA